MLDVAVSVDGWEFASNMCLRRVWEEEEADAADDVDDADDFTDAIIAFISAISFSS